MFFVFCFFSWIRGVLTILERWSEEDDIKGSSTAVGGPSVDAIMKLVCSRVCPLLQFPAALRGSPMGGCSGPCTANILAVFCCCISSGSELAQQGRKGSCSAGCSYLVEETTDGVYPFIPSSLIHCCCNRVCNTCTYCLTCSWAGEANLMTLFGYAGLF